MAPIALTVEDSAIIVGWGRSYIQKQTSCLGISLLIQNVVYDTNTGKYNITVLNNGEQQVIAERLKVGFVDISGQVDYARNITVYAMDGTQLDHSQPIGTNWKVIIVAGLPSIITRPAYIFINHEICGKISNDYLLG